MSGRYATDPLVLGVYQAPRLLTVVEVARLYRVSRRTVYRWRREGIIETARTPTGRPRIVATSLTDPSPHYR